MADTAAQLDTRIAVVTPENIAFDYRLAGPFRRLLAYIIDLIVRGIVFWAAAIGIGIVFGMAGLGGFGVMILLLLWFAMDWFYGGILETYWNGQTVGKKLMRLRVMTINGQPINGMQAMIRNFLRLVDGQPVSTCLVGALATMSNKRFQRIGDLTGGTMVVVEDRNWRYGLVRLDEPAVASLAADLPAGYDIPRSLGQALAAYVERRRFFSPARRADIARHVADPLRVRFGLPPETGHDLLLCALYYRTFITDSQWNDSRATTAMPPVIGPPQPVSAALSLPAS